MNLEVWCVDPVDFFLNARGHTHVTGSRLFVDEDGQERARGKIRKEGKNVKVE